MSLFPTDHNLNDQIRVNKRQRIESHSEHTSFKRQSRHLGSNLIVDNIKAKNIQPSWINLATEMNNNVTCSFVLDNSPGMVLLISEWFSLILYYIKLYVWLFFTTNMKRY